MNYLVIDLEMCKVPKHYRTKQYKYGHEIIQIGAVLLDEKFEIIGKINQYVHPVHGVIDNYISKLTGIQSNQVKQAPRLEEALLHMLDWIGDRDFKVYAWSESDYKQLEHEMTGKEIANPRLVEFMDQERWLDYQAVFGKRFDFAKAISLSEALMYCNIDVDGRLHDGLDDAVNTARLINVLENHDDFVLYKEELNLEADSETLNFTMGGLFAGLNLGFCVS